MTRKSTLTIEDAAPAIERKELVRELAVPLTQEERLTLGSEMAKQAQELQRSLNRKKEVGAQLAADVEAHRAEVVRLGNLLSNGYEYRKIDCEMVIDRAAEFVTVTRTDTGEVVEKRPLRPEERQAELPI